MSKIHIISPTLGGCHPLSHLSCIGASKKIDKRICEDVVYLFSFHNEYTLLLTNYGVKRRTRSQQWKNIVRSTWNSTMRRVWQPRKTISSIISRKLAISGDKIRSNFETISLFRIDKNNCRQISSVELIKESLHLYRTKLDEYFVKLVRCTLLSRGKYILEYIIMKSYHSPNLFQLFQDTFLLCYT